MRTAFLVLLLACGKREESASQPPAPVARPEPARPPACEKPGDAVCVDDEVVECRADGSLGKRLEQCNARCHAGKCVETCAVRDVELVYVVDDRHNLLSFDPKKLPDDPFHPIARLDCEQAQTPFSMGVDRMGIAWVLYRSGTLYRVSIIDGKCMQGRKPTGGPQLFGMGFVSDGPGATTEKLYVAAFEAKDFGILDVSQKAPSWLVRGQLADRQNPELSGTGAGKLFGFFPDDGGFVSEIDPASGKLLGTRILVGAPRGDVGAWAFAHWGGKFYVFVTIENNSMVFEVDGKARTSKRVLENLPREIVGAGVSTCAPLLEQAP